MGCLRDVAVSTIHHGEGTNEKILDIGKSGKRHVFGEAGDELLDPESRYKASQGDRAAGATDC